MQKYTIALVGAGNLATHLALALHEAGHDIQAICARTPQSAHELNQKINQKARVVEHVGRLPTTQITIIATKDDAIVEVAQQIAQNPQRGVLVHTAGSVPLKVLERVGQDYGVIYPLQTFSKHRGVDFSTIPCFIEGDSDKTTQMLAELARSVTSHVQILDSTLREKLHLAAIFACNFTNHLYEIATQIAQEAEVSTSYLHPLILETAKKLQALSPYEAQTGPARRGDQAILNKHLAMLQEHPNRQDLYRTFSDSIQNLYNKK